MNSSQLLKTLRFNLGLTQNQLAKNLGTTQQVITMIENGHRDIPKSMVKSLWDVYKIPCYSILNEHESLLSIIQGKNTESPKENTEDLKTFKLNLIATIKCKSKKELLKSVADSFLQDVEMIDIMEQSI